MKEKIYKLIFSGFYMGYLPYARGTFGSIVGLILFVLTRWTFYSYQIFLYIIFLVISYNSINFAIKIYKDEDPPVVVCDEILGMWFSLLFFDLNLYQILLAFLIFRFFDILKPFPIRLIEKKFKGPIGVIFDDIMAGVYTKLILILVLVGF